MIAVEEQIKEAAQIFRNVLEAAARFGQIMFYESRYSGALKIGTM